MIVHIVAGTFAGGRVQSRQSADAPAAGAMLPQLVAREQKHDARSTFALLSRMVEQFRASQATSSHAEWHEALSISVPVVPQSQRTGVAQPSTTCPGMRIDERRNSATSLLQNWKTR